MKTTLRSLSLLGLLALGTQLSFACKPTSGGFDGGCNQAVAGPPDGSVSPTTCNTWTGGCASGSSDALEAAIAQLVADAGACQQDSDCVFLTDGGPYEYGGVKVGSVQPVGAAQVVAFQNAIENLICSYNSQCEDGGAQISLGVPNLTPQSQLCLSCAQGQCTSNLLILDGGM